MYAKVNMGALPERGSATAVTKRRNAWLMLAFALWLGAGFVFVGSCRPETLGVFSSDDAFYYFLTARNVALGNGVTFDGINDTNGFHPLWLAVVTPIFWLTGGEHDSSLRIIYGVLFLLFTGSIVLTYRLLRRMVGAAPALLALLLFVNPAIFNFFFNGLESALLIVTLLVLLNLGCSTDLTSPQMGWRNQIAAGFLLGLVFLARLDCAFHLIGLALVATVAYQLKVWNPHQYPSLLRSYGCLLLTFAAVVMPYLVWNLAANGHMAPISGAIKSSFPHLQFDPGRLQKLSWAPYTLFIAASMLTIALAIVYRGRVADLFRRAKLQRSGVILVLGFWVGCALHFGYSFFFTFWPADSWHFASYVPLIFVFAGTAFAFLWRFSRILTATTAVMILVGSGCLLALSLSEKVTHHGVWHTAAVWAKENTSPESIFAMTDCGYFSYFSRRTTVNLDGLINSYDYQLALESGTLDEFLEDCGVDYFNGYEVPDWAHPFYSIRLKSFLFGSGPRKQRIAYHILLPTDGDFVWRSEPYDPYIHEHNGSEIRFYIWEKDSARVKRLQNS